MIAFSEDDVNRSIISESFYEFVLEFWEIIVPDEFVPNWHIEYLCDELQQIAERVFENENNPYDLIINVPPGSTKSTIISIMFPAWIMARKPSMRIICVSHTDTLVLDLSRKSRDVVKSEKYAALFPNVKLRDDQDTKGYWATTAGGFRFSCTVGGKTPTGFHAHFILVDDPIDPKKALSTAELKDANSYMGQTLSSRKVDKNVTATVVVMQRLHQDDPSGHRLAQQEGLPIKHICLPADLGYPVFPEELRFQYTKGLLDARRLSRKVLNNVLPELGEYGYAGQYGQSPIPRGGAIFQVDRITIAKLLSTPLKKVVRYWDKAATAGGGAYTVGLKMGITQPLIGFPHGQVWIMDIERGQWDSAVRERRIKQTAHSDTKQVRIGVEQEPGSGGKESAENTIRRLMGFICIADRPTGDKVTRADPFSSMVNGGAVFLLEAAWNREYLEELRFFPNSLRKDQVDASSGAFAMLTKPTLRAGAF